MFMIKAKWNQTPSSRIGVPIAQDDLLITMDIKYEESKI